MRSLSVRLFLSYLFMLLLTLAVTGVTLFLLIAIRPVPNAAVVNNLGTQIYTFLNTLELDGASFPIESLTRLQRQQLSTYANRLNIRVLIRRGDGTITYDSYGIANAERIRIGEHADFADESFTLLSANANASQVGPLVWGTFHSPRGSDWLYVGQAVTDARGPEGQFIVFATDAPHITLEQIWQFYGSDVLLPLVQAGLVGLVVALIFAIVIARSVVRPLRNVADTARAIALGQRDRKAKVQGPREVRTLAEAFNGMLDQVQAGSNAQREFLANVSHDLRTPLTSIQGYSQALMDGVANTPEGTHRAAQVINEEAARMYRMVEELLDLARIEAGKLSMTRYKVLIGDLAQSVSDRMLIMARAKGLALVTTIDPGLPIVAGDGDRLSQVFTNLIENALKHTPPGGTVTLSVTNNNEKEADGVLIAVHDTGEGIPAADLPRIFDRFYQVDKSRQRHDGVGLGLQICFQIVEAHGGRIWVESEEGRWTRFSVWLPGFSFDSTTIVKRRTGGFAAVPNHTK